jgi:deoxyribodipyrimidine photolyase-related protein
MSGGSGGAAPSGVRGDAPTSATLRVVLGDQLSTKLAALADIGPHDTVLMVEVERECTYVRHHKQKIVLILSAMRHFAEALRARGDSVRYVTLDDPDNTQSFRGEVVRAAHALRPSRIVVTEPGEWRVLEDMRAWQDEAGCPVEILSDDRFLCSTADFRHWAESRRSLRMEFFYRDMRRRTGLLMDDGEPAGGRWNYDAARHRSSTHRRLPARRHHARRPGPRRDAVRDPFRRRDPLRLARDRRGGRARAG